MKNILVPTDFSACAEYALEAAVFFAKFNDAVIHLVHVIEPLDSRRSASAGLEILLKEKEQYAENSLTLLNALTDEYPWNKYEIKLLEGKVTDAIKSYLSDKSIDLVVMGSHGVQDKKRSFMGSNAQKFVRELNRKVLVIKEPLGSLNFEEVVYASGFNVNEYPSIDRFIDFIRPFAKRVHLVYINTDLFFGLPSSVVKGIMEETKARFHPMEVETHYLKDYSVEHGIRHISEKLNASLVGISNHSKHTLKRIFSGSTVEALVNLSALPILSIDYADEDMEENSGKPNSFMSIKK